MIWLILREQSHQIRSCNIHQEENEFQLWVTRPNGKNMKVLTSESLDEISDYKSGIDFAIENGHKTFKIDIQ